MFDIEIKKQFGLGAKYFDGIIYNAVFIEFDHIEKERYGEKYVVNKKEWQINLEDLGTLSIDEIRLRFGFQPL